MTSSAVFYFFNSAMPFQLIRSLVHLFVLFSLIVHQFIFQPFIEPNLSVGIYSLCFLMLFIDSLCLFFYKGNQESLFPYLLLVDAVFLSSLVVIVGPSALFFVFFLVFSQAFSLFLFEKSFLSLVFLLYLSALLPISFLWGERLSFDERLSLMVLIQVVLFFTFCIGWLFQKALGVVKDKDLKSQGVLPEESPKVKLSDSIGMSLELARKLKPVVNFLMKHFPENTTHKQDRTSVSSNLFPSQKGRHQLEKMRNFILDFIEYAEPQTETLMKDVVDLKELLETLLKKMETHFHRPENLTLQVELKEDLKVKGSASHLAKCFEHIIINSFEALKNQETPKVFIQGYVEKSWILLKFIDNGHGIESENMKKLFNPMFSNRFGMKGLGLSYVQKILKSHNAVLDIESSPQGTKVVIQIPLDYSFYDDQVKFLKTTYKQVS